MPATAAPVLQEAPAPSSGMPMPPMGMPTPVAASDVDAVVPESPEIMPGMATMTMPAAPKSQRVATVIPGQVMTETVHSEDSRPISTQDDLASLKKAAIAPHSTPKAAAQDAQSVQRTAPVIHSPAPTKLEMPAPLHKKVDAPVVPIKTNDDIAPPPTRAGPLDKPQADPVSHYSDSNDFPNETHTPKPRTGDSVVYDMPKMPVMRMPHSKPVAVGGATNLNHLQSHPRVQTYIEQVLNNMHRACGMENKVARAMHVLHAEEQVQNGASYTARVSLDFHADLPSEEFSVTIERLARGNDAEVHERPGSSPRTADEFSVVAVQPRPCALEAMYGEEDVSPATTANLLQASRYTGYVAPDPATVHWDTTVLTEEDARALPGELDWRSTHIDSQAAIFGAYNQGGCGSCYAWAAMTAYAYRMTIHSKGKYDVFPSPQSAIQCGGASSNGCHGGAPSTVYQAMHDRGGFAAMWCAKYDLHYNENVDASDNVLGWEPVGQCGTGCGESLKYEPAAMANTDYDHQQFSQSVSAGCSHCATKGDINATTLKIMHKLQDGPVAAMLRATSDFQGHKGWGVYDRECAPDCAADHAVTLVGYGHDAVAGKDYWIMQNSWGTNWGSGGFARLAKGVDTLGIESSGITTVMPKVPNECSDAPKCQNGGSYTGDCKCHCANGFSGATCDVCDRSCESGNLAGPSFVEDGKCTCKCRPTWYSVGGKECAVQIALEGSTEKVITASTQPNARVSLKVQNQAKVLLTGDMLFAVPKGVKPHTAVGGWAAGGRKTYICGEPEENKNCPSTEALEPGYSRNHGVLSHLPAKVTCKVELATEDDVCPTENVVSSEPVLYDVYFYKYLGKNEFGGSKGWGDPLLLSQQIFSDGCYDVMQRKNYCEVVETSYHCRTQPTPHAAQCMKSCGKCQSHAAPKATPAPPTAATPPKNPPTPPAAAPGAAPAPPPSEEQEQEAAASTQPEAKTKTKASAAADDKTAEQAQKKAAEEAKAKAAHDKAVAKQEAADKAAAEKAAAEKAAAEKAGAEKAAAEKAGAEKSAAEKAVVKAKTKAASPAPPRYPSNPSDSCQSFCATHSQTKGTAGCGYSQCQGCPLCDFACYDKLSPEDCNDLTQQYGPTQEVSYKGAQTPFYKLCPATLGVCEGEKWGPPPPPPPGYPSVATSTCKSFCAYKPETTGPAGCKYSQCKGCPGCKEWCYDKYTACPHYAEQMGCSAAVRISGEQATIDKFCPKSCHKCGSDDSWKDEPQLQLLDAEDLETDTWMNSTNEPAPEPSPSGSGAGERQVKADNDASPQERVHEWEHYFHDANEPLDHGPSNIVEAADQMMKRLAQGSSYVDPYSTHHDDFRNHMNPDQDRVMHKLQARDGMPVTHGVSSSSTTISTSVMSLVEEEPKSLYEQQSTLFNELIGDEEGELLQVPGSLVKQGRQLEQNLKNLDLFKALYGHGQKPVLDMPSSVYVPEPVPVKLLEAKERGMDASAAPGESAEAAVKQDKKMTAEQAVGEWRHFYDDANEDVEDGKTQEHKTTVEEDGTVSEVPDEIRILAHEVDTDGDGKISLAEFLSAANRTGELSVNLTQLEAKHVFEMVDDDDSGKLTVQEFGNAFEVHDDWQNHMNPNQDMKVHQLQARDGMSVTHGVAPVRLQPVRATQAKLLVVKEVQKEQLSADAAEKVAVATKVGTTSMDNPAERQVKIDAKTPRKVRFTKWKRFFDEANKDVNEGKEFHTEKDGTLSATDDATRELAHNADTDGDGKISRDEWLAAVKTPAIKQLANMTESQANNTFQMMDRDEDGKLTVQGFANAFKGDDEWQNHLNPNQDMKVHQLQARDGMSVTHGVAASTTTSAGLVEEKELEEDLQSNGVYWYSRKEFVPSAEIKDVPQATEKLVESIAPPEISFVDNSLYEQQSRLFDRMFNVSSPELKALERDSMSLIQNQPKSFSEQRSQLLDQMFNLSTADLALLKH